MRTRGSATGGGKRAEWLRSFRHVRERPRMVQRLVCGRLLSPLAGSQSSGPGIGFAACLTRRLVAASDPVQPLCRAFEHSSGVSLRRLRISSGVRRRIVVIEDWLRGRDLNSRPLGYEPNELPDCSTPRQGRRTLSEAKGKVKGIAASGLRPLGYEPNELSPDSFRSPGRSCEGFFVETRKPDDGDAGAHRRGGLTSPSVAPRDGKMKPRKRLRAKRADDREECGLDCSTPRQGRRTLSEAKGKVKGTPNGSGEEPVLVMFYCARGEHYSDRLLALDAGGGQRPLRGQAAGRVQNDDIARRDEIQLLAGSLLGGKLVAIRSFDRGFDLVVLSAQIPNLLVELLDLGARLLQLEDPAIRDEQETEQHRRSRERDEERHDGARAPRGRRHGAHAGNTSRPANRPTPARSSSISSSRLYFASRSPRQAEPVLIRPALTATARSAIESSGVSPERWETTVR